MMPLTRFIPRLRPRSGFTLVDLLIVLVVLVIASALVLPMGSSTDSTKLTAAARMVVADLEYTQIESLSHPSDLRLVLFTSTSYALVATSNTNTPLTHPVDHQPYQTYFGYGRAKPLTGVKFSNLSLQTSNQLAFGSFGQLTQTSSAVLTLQSGSRRVDITLEAATGNATIGSAY